MRKKYDLDRGTPHSMESPRRDEPNAAPRTLAFQEAPRLAALSDADLKTQRSNRAWIPTAARAAILDPTHWTRRARQERYWRLVEALSAAKVH